MTRERFFCKYCGAVTESETRACRAHRDLLTEDYRFDTDSLLEEDVPMQAAPVREDSSATRERGR